MEAIVGAAEVNCDSRPKYAPQKHAIVLAVQDLARLPKVRGVSFELRHGEVLGIGGLVGAGRSELARLIYGADRADAGRMTLEGKPYAPKSPAAAVGAGVGLVPEERRTEGLFLSKSVAFNLGLVNLDKLVIEQQAAGAQPKVAIVAGSRNGAPAGDQGWKHSHSRWPAQRRQPAEGGDRALAAARAASADSR